MMIPAILVFLGTYWGLNLFDVLMKMWLGPDYEDQPRDTIFNVGAAIVSTMVFLSGK